MGLDTEIAEIAREESAKSDHKFSFSQLPRIQGPTRYIEDTLTRAVWNPGHRGDFLYTGIEFFDMWLQPFLKYFNTMQCTAAVSSFDAYDNVPKQKAKTQLARTIAAAQAKKREEAKTGQKLPEYKDGMLFNDEGIYDPKVKDSTVMFDIRSVRGGPRNVRLALWKYLMDRMKHTRLPDGCTLFLENDSRGAWRFENDQEFKRDMTTAHNHGESDPSTAFWWEHLCIGTDGKNHSTAVIRSKDADCIPVLLYALELRSLPEQHRVGERKPLYWMANNEQFYEMRGYRSMVKYRLRLTVSQYMIFCILCGTDFYGKEGICRGFGARKILDAMQSVKNEFNAWDTHGFVEEIIEAKKDEETNEEKQSREEKEERKRQREKKELHGVAAFVRQLYQNKLSGSTASSSIISSVFDTKKTSAPGDVPGLYSYTALARMVTNKKWKKIQMPTEAAIEQAYKDISWNYRYWRSRAHYPAGMMAAPKPEEESEAIDSLDAAMDELPPTLYRSRAEFLSPQPSSASASAYNASAAAANSYTPHKMQAQLRPAVRVSVTPTAGFYTPAKTKAKLSPMEVKFGNESPPPKYRRIGNARAAEDSAFEDKLPSLLPEINAARNAAAAAAAQVSDEEDDTLFDSKSNEEAMRELCASLKKDAENFQPRAALSASDATAAAAAGVVNRTLAGTNRSGSKRGRAK